ncbi:ABC transporter ATP-binding protein [Cuniculiplasma sp. SKW3]|uniref:ABC transporter ATP-binding protein n=1 Tax=Cuniculiplasma sp. SKW3 TaxID=3400170 RepID=UPI003FD24CB1
MIELNGVSKVYGRSSEGVRKISYTFESGKVYGLVGPNGAGKTTLIRMLSGSHTQSEGSIVVDNYDIIKDRESALIRVGWMPDASILNGYWRIIDQFEYFGVLRGLGSVEAKTKAIELLKGFGIDQNLWNKTMRKLSLGQRRRVSLAFAVLNDPANILMDEPYNGFDPDGIRMISEFILNERNKGKTVIVSSHILKELESVADEVIMIEKGRIVDSISKNSLEKSELIKITLEVKNPDDTILELLESLGDVRRIGNRFEITCSSEEKVEDLNTSLVKSGYKVTLFKTEKPTVEDFYFSKGKNEK